MLVKYVSTSSMSSVDPFKKANFKAQQEKLGSSYYLIISINFKTPHLVRWTVTVCCRSEIAPFLLISATFFDVLIFYNVIASFNSNFMWFAPWDSILDIYHSIPFYHGKKVILPCKGNSMYTRRVFFYSVELQRSEMSSYLLFAEIQLKLCVNKAMLISGMSSRYPILLSLD